MFNRRLKKVESYARIMAEIAQREMSAHGNDHEGRYSLLMVNYYHGRLAIANEILNIIKEKLT